LPHKDNKKLNISFSVNKKIGNAVKRNKIKRRLRSIVNDAVKIISINFDFSILVLAKESMLNNEYKNIKETLFQDLEKIK
jgi:ribonuclease P protein component